MPNWTLAQLRTLSAVAEAGSMSAAAGRLGYTVGAISQQMTALQREAGQTLFIKDGRHLVLSDAGRLLHRHTAAILAAEADASAALGALGAGIDSTVRLGVFGSAALSCAAPAVRTLAATDPRIRVEFVELDPDDMVAAAVAGTVDAALGLDYTDFPLPVAASLSRRTILSEPLLAVAPGRGRRAAGKSAAAEIGTGAGWLLPPAESTFGKAARMALAAAGIDPTVDHTVTDTALALGLAADGFGWTVATGTMLAFHHTDADSVELPGGKRRDVVVLTRHAALERPSVARVAEALAEAGGRRRE